MAFVHKVIMVAVKLHPPSPPHFAIQIHLACHSTLVCLDKSSVLNCPQTDREDDHPILRKEVEVAVQSLKKGKSAGVDNIPAELVQADGEDVITALTTICNKI